MKVDMTLKKETKPNICTCTCKYTHTHTHTHIYIYIYIYTHTHLFKHTHTHMYGRRSYRNGYRGSKQRRRTELNSEQGCLYFR